MSDVSFMCQAPSGPEQETLRMDDLTPRPRRWAAVAAAVGSVLATPAPALAHTRWVVRPDEVPRYVPHPLVHFFTSTTSRYPWVGLLALVAVAVALVLDSRLTHVLPRLRRALELRRGLGAHALRLALGALMLHGAWSSQLFFPDLPSDWLPARIVEAVSGLLLIVGGAGVPAALLGVLGIYGLAIADFGTMALDYLMIVGVTAYLALNHDRRLADRGPTAMALMRLAVGVSLLLPGLDKFLEPDLNLAVIVKYGMSVPGVPDALFLYGAGWVECTLGAVVLLGLVPRLTATAVLLLFAGATAGGTLVAHMHGEFFGHLLILAFALTYLLEGRPAEATSAASAARTPLTSLPKEARHA